MCDYLRDLTSIELFNNLQFYACHPYIKEKPHVFQSENTAFSATASDAALADGYDMKDPSSRVEVVKREAIRNATSKTHASFMCLFALSSVTGMVVTSVYLKHSNSRQSTHNFKMEPFFHGWHTTTYRVNWCKKQN